MQIGGEGPCPASTQHLVGSPNLLELGVNRGDENQEDDEQGERSHTDVCEDKASDSHSTSRLPDLQPERERP